MHDEHKKRAYLLEGLYKSLCNKGLVLEREVYSVQYDEDSEIKTFKNCAFCVPEIIMTQKVFEKEGIAVLHNVMPLIKDAHFLVIPTRHSDHYLDMSTDEIAAMYGMAKRLIQALQNKYGRNDVKMLLREGYEVGQSVFHPHLHVLLTPDPVRHMVSGLNFETFPRVTKAEFEQIRQEIAPLMSYD